VRITDDPVSAATRFAAAGITVPGYDVTAAPVNPCWLHLGGGNLFRALHAQIAQNLLRGRAMTGGIAVADIDQRIAVDRVYRPYDNRHIAVVLRPDGTIGKELIASVAESLYVGDDRDWRRMCEIARDPALRLVTLTVTEKGYALTGPDGAWSPGTAHDMDAGPSRPRTAMGAIVGLLWTRYRSTGAPIAVVSTDNFSRNGELLRDVVRTLADELVRRGSVDAGFVAWLDDPTRVAYPCTMVDRITPNPSRRIADALIGDGVEDVELVRVSPATVMSCFSNTEEPWYLVVEDNFPNGRPPLERAGVLLAGREQVNRADEMKVTACLNPLHTALALFGMLLGYDRIWREMADADLRGLVFGLGYREALPVVISPGIVDPAAFLDEVLHRRLPNPALPDSPSRIAADTSQKVSIRFGVTLRKYAERGELSGLRLIPLVLAAWPRYLMGVDDSGSSLALSPDPRLDELRARVSGLRLGADNTAAALDAVAMLADVVGVGLGVLAPVIAQDVAAMASAPGAVRRRLHDVVGGVR
jgi:fructuronate reductase